jgi:hypothetical protein
VRNLLPRTGTGVVFADHPSSSHRTTSDARRGRPRSPRRTTTRRACAGSMDPVKPTSRLERP